ncbi:MAG: 23S rRNA (guanosine(2251)-2'-O)-methyltransferase RlmB [Burkholderiales bacterium]|nr:23S rRNA (guanosine(2251)-2'-O)-methyltransferase RlmB [Burkholderiales bacterium]
MATTRLLLGFHAVASRLRQRAATVREVYLDAARRDARALDLARTAKACGVRVVEVDGARLDGMAGGGRHQGVIAVADAVDLAVSLDDVLDAVTGAPLILVLDGVTDPHNLGACLRTADAAGVHAVIAPKDRAVGLNATVIKVASGAADTVPYITVTNLARALRELKERDIRVIGADEGGSMRHDAPGLAGPLAWVLGAEGEGLRRLTRETCDELRAIPMAGAIQSLNVSVAAGVCLFEAVRQRSA